VYIRGPGRHHLEGDQNDALAPRAHRDASGSTAASSCTEALLALRRLLAFGAALRLTPLRARAAILPIAAIQPLTTVRDRLGASRWRLL